MITVEEIRKECQRRWESKEDLALYKYKKIIILIIIITIPSTLLLCVPLPNTHYDPECNTTHEVWVRGLKDERLERGGRGREREREREKERESEGGRKRERELSCAHHVVLLYIYYII